jgi:hypothetical protein
MEKSLLKTVSWTASLFLIVFFIKIIPIKTGKDIVFKIDADKFSKAVVFNQYRTSAQYQNLNYKYKILAGSGIEGNQDGAGMYAQFMDPVDIFMTDEKTLFVLDNGSKSIKKILIDPRRVSSVLDYSKVGSSSFKKMVVNNKIFILWIRQGKCSGRLMKNQQI